LGAAPPCKAEEPKKAVATVYQVPYKLTEVKHVLLRAKINGKGPFNFILDTGAPALFVSTAVCKKLGIEPDKKGWGTFDQFEIEGGVKIPKAKGRIEDPFQLEGMNALGLAGAELHGVIGYNILARYKLEFDFTKDKMNWTPLDFEPKAPAGVDGKSGGGDMQAMAGMIKLLTAFLGKQPDPVIKQRGYMGMELIDSDKKVAIKAVLKDGPAAKAGLQVDDQITHFKGKAIKGFEDLRKLAGEVAAGDSVKIKVRRAGESQEFTIKAGEGL
jgi:serine protease DegQ